MVEVTKVSRSGALLATLAGLLSFALLLVGPLKTSDSLLLPLAQELFIGQFVKNSHRNTRGKLLPDAPCKKFLFGIQCQPSLLTVERFLGSVHNFAAPNFEKIFRMTLQDGA